MRILLAAPQPFYQERGTPIAVRMLAETLCAQGHAVDLLTFHEGADLDFPGLTILRTPAVPGIRDIPIGISWKKLVCDLLLSVRLVTLALTRHYDVIHAVEEAVFPAVLLRRLARARVVYDMDSLLGEQLLHRWSILRPLRQALQWLERAAIRRVDAVFAVCRELATQATDCAPSVPVFLIEDVALPEAAGRTCAEPLRETLGIRGVLALYVGNLQRYQGVDDLVRAMRHVPDDVTLVLIGGSEPDLSRTVNLIRTLKLEGRVFAVGPRPLAQLAGYLRQADVLVSPRALGRNTPMKIYSYMHSGRAILATAIRSHTQVLDDSCAYLTPQGEAGLAQGLQQLAADELLRARLGASASRRARDRYSMGAFQDKVRQAYHVLEMEGAPAGVTP